MNRTLLLLQRRLPDAPGSPSRNLRHRLAIALLAAVLPAAAWAQAPSVPVPDAAGPATGETEKEFRVIAHRGASAYAPENTLPAFEKAREMGAREVELDVQLSRDGHVVLFHDDDLERKTGTSGRVRDHDVATLRTLDVGTWFDTTHPDANESFAGRARLATLDELFDAYGDTFFFHVELKSTEAELPEKVLEAIDRHGLRDRVAIASFDFGQLLRTRARDEDVSITWLVPVARAAASEAAEWERLRGAADRAVESGFQQIGVAASELTPELVRHVHGRGLKVRAWKVRSEADVVSVLDAGADGMTVNWPDRAFAILEERGAPVAPAVSSAGPTPDP